MLLPKLKIKAGEVRDAVECEGLDTCATCVFYEKNGGRCSGCTKSKRDALAEEFQVCYRECDGCTGYKVEVTAICCRSPLKEVYMNAVTGNPENWNEPIFKYTKRPKLTFKQKAVFVIAAGGGPAIAASRNTTLVPESHEVVAVSLRNVWSGRGFYSQDLKDYLKLAPSTKLVMLTNTLDDLLERAWEHESYGGPEFTRVGIDAWMPLVMSTYKNDAHMHQLYQTYRSLYAAAKGQAWFVGGSSPFYGIKVDDLVHEATKFIPQMTFGTQFIVDDVMLKSLLRTVAHYHKLVDPRVAFWFLGANKPTLMHNIRQNIGDRDAYFLSPTLLQLANKGKRLTPEGKVVLDGVAAKYDLLQENYANYAALVKRYGEVQP
jgi:hypothetical protein